MSTLHHTKKMSIAIYAARLMLNMLFYELLLHFIYYTDEVYTRASLPEGQRQFAFKTFERTAMLIFVIYSQWQALLICVCLDFVEVLLFFAAGM